MTECKFTVAELWALGLRGDQYHDEWTINPAVVDVREGKSRKGYDSVEVVFTVDDVLWRVVVSFPQGDWDSNDLNLPKGERATYSITAVNVVARTTRTSTYEPVKP